MIGKTNEWDLRPSHPEVLRLCYQQHPLAHLDHQAPAHQAHHLPQILIMTAMSPTGARRRKGTKETEKRRKTERRKRNWQEDSEAQNSKRARNMPVCLQSCAKLQIVTNNLSSNWTVNHLKEEEH